MKNFDLSLYLVLDPGLCGETGMVETARLAAGAGATLVQLRHKHASTEEMIAIGRELKNALAGTGALLVINDDVDAAIAIGADGVHVGQSDMAAAAVREKIGPDMILGVSMGTEDLARAVDPAVIDYIGVGPVFATQTKSDHKTPIGFQGVANVVAVSPVPVVAIGGLKVQHVADVIATGADGLAVVSAICGQPDPAGATREIAAAIAEARG